MSKNVFSLRRRCPQFTGPCRIHNVLLDFAGGLLSVAQLVMDCSVNDDWSGAIGDPVKVRAMGMITLNAAPSLRCHTPCVRAATNPLPPPALQFGLGFTSMVFDIIFMTQHYCLYPSAEDGVEYDSLGGKEGEEGGWADSDGHDSESSRL